MTRELVMMYLAGATAVSILCVIAMAAGMRALMPPRAPDISQMPDRYAPDYLRNTPPDQAEFFRGYTKGED